MRLSAMAHSGMFQTPKRFSVLWALKKYHRASIPLYDGKFFKVCDKKDADLTGHIQLPDNWTDALLIT